MPKSIVLALILRVQRCLSILSQAGKGAFQLLCRCLGFGVRIAVALCPWAVPYRWRPPYRYKPLQSTSHIRLLELLPSTELRSVLLCRLQEMPIDKLTSPYTAISYTWGSRKELDPFVICDGFAVNIPRNLDSALRRVRSMSEHSQVLWTDALCINQNTDSVAIAERNAQVQMMDRVFASAHKVVVDLGDAEPADIEVLQHLDRYQALPQERWHAAVVEMASSQPQWAACSLELDIPQDTSPFWDLFAKFMNRPWFTRLWVLQEFALARSVSFLIGTQLWPEMLLRDGILRATKHLDVLRWAQRMSDRPYDERIATENQLWACLSSKLAAKALFAVRNRIMNTRSFAELLHTSSFIFETTDPRDRGYALLGLASDSDIKQKLAVDYNEPLGDLQLRVANYLLRAGFSIYALYHAVGDQAGAVSWAFDLEGKKRDSLTRLVSGTGYVQPEVFSASLPMHFKARASPHRKNGLTVRGWHVDIVDRVMSSSFPSLSEFKSPTEVRTHNPWLAEASEWMNSATVEGTNDVPAFRHICWRTLIADLVVADGEPGNDFIRLRDWAKGDACVDAMDRGILLTTKTGVGSSAIDESQALEIVDLIRVYGESLIFACGRKLGRTTNGTVCLLPGNTQKGDTVVIIRSCQIPFVLRPQVDAAGEYFRVVGCAFVHGYMDGEIERIGDHELKDIELG